jgi:hypothetical protein
MKTKRFPTIVAVLLIIVGKAFAQNMTEIHYFSDIYHGPNSVCQSCDGNILVECDLVNEGVNIGSKLLKFSKQGACLDSLLLEDEAKIMKSYICANPFGEGDIWALLRFADGEVSVRIRHLDPHLAITGQTDVLLPLQWASVFAVRFFLDQNNNLIIAFNSGGLQDYRMARISLDGNLLDCIESARFKQLKVTFAGTPFFQYSESPMQYGCVAMPSQGSNTVPTLFVLDSLFNVVAEEPIATINGANVNYSNMQAVARINDGEWLYSCRMGLQSDGVFWNQLTKFGKPLEYQAEYRVYNEVGEQNMATCYPIPEGSVKVTDEGIVYHACMDYHVQYPGYLNITCLNPDLTVRWRIRYPETPDYPHGLNMCVLDDGSAVVCGYNSTEGDVYDMFLLVLEDAGAGVAETVDPESRVEVYPNPGGNTFNIRTALQNARVEVYDTNGRLVHSQALKENVTAIDAGDWAEGVYVWKVMANGKIVETGKWVKA